MVGSDLSARDMSETRPHLPRLGNTRPSPADHPTRAGDDDEPVPPGASDVQRVAQVWRKTSRRIAAVEACDLLADEDEPRRIGRYELRDPLGEGGCGVVYRAWDPRHEREVAVKVLFRTDERARKRFEREVKATARLRHKAIVPLLDSGEADDALYLVMELVEGRSLFQLAEEGGLDPQQAARAVHDVAEAIHFAHSQGVLHRDIKPHNVLVGRDGRAQVVDFGLARLEGRDSRLTRTGTAVGTPCYMAPEQVRGGEDGLDARSDVYALGATLYHVLTGRVPFEGESLEEVFAGVLGAPPLAPRELAAGVPRDLETICLKCLEKEPAERYPDAQALADDLGRFLRGEHVLARRPAPGERALRWARRNRLAAGLGLALVALLGAFLALLVTLWS